MQQVSQFHKKIFLNFLLSFMNTFVFVFQTLNVLARPPNLSTVWLKNICPTCNWELKKEWKFSPTISILFFFFEKEIFFWFFLSLLKKSSLSLFLWMVAVNNRLFQKTKQTNKKPSDHMKKNVNKQLIIWKKKIQEKPETYTYIQRRLEAVTYILHYIMATYKKILVFCCLI